MVNFTCNKCGESLKKKDVVTHFARNVNCRQAATLTCVDCLKEFGQDYASHTICVTEDQRYSANGLKGLEKNKQQVWSESLHQHFRSILATQGSSLSKSMVNLLEYLLNIPSLPRKEKSFINLVDNVHRFTDGDARSAWNMVADFIKQQQSQAKPDDVKSNPKKVDAIVVTEASNDKTPTKDKKKTKSTEAAEKSDKKNLDDDTGASKKKKKESKKAAESNGDVEEANANGETPSDAKESKKQKKKKEPADTPQISEDIPMEVEEEVTGETKDEEEKLSKKERKLKKKREKYEAEMRALEEAAKSGEEATETIEGPVVEEGKKKKSKKHALEAEENLEAEKKSKKKRERTMSMAAETDQPNKKNKQKENDENTKPNEEAEAAVPNRKAFNWGEVIIQVLRSQHDNEMSVKRLCKKVVNEYLSSLLEAAHVDEVKATTKFQKKLQKTPGVFVHKDKAKLKATD